MGNHQLKLLSGPPNQRYYCNVTFKKGYKDNKNEMNKMDKLKPLQEKGKNKDIERRMWGYMILKTLEIGKDLGFERSTYSELERVLCSVSEKLGKVSPFSPYKGRHGFVKSRSSYKKLRNDIFSSELTEEEVPEKELGEEEIIEDIVPYERISEIGEETNYGIEKMGKEEAQKFQKRVDPIIESTLIRKLAAHKLRKAIIAFDKGRKEAFKRKTEEADEILENIKIYDSNGNKTDVPKFSEEISNMLNKVEGNTGVSPFSYVGEKLEIKGDFERPNREYQSRDVPLKAYNKSSEFSFSFS